MRLFLPKTAGTSLLHRAAFLRARSEVPSRGAKSLELKLSGSPMERRGQQEEYGMLRRDLVSGLAVLALGTLVAGGAAAQDTVKIGLILPMTGQQTSTGKQIDAAVRLYMQQNGNTVAGKKIEVILKDDGAVPDATRRLAQELIVNDKVSIIAGFGVTP